MLNARSALHWLEEGGVDDPYGRVIALTAEPDKAIELGVDETRDPALRRDVGGRYSLWSSIGFPAALALGWDAFESLLEGAAAMDRHFRFAPLAANAPVLAAFADRLLRQCRAAPRRARVFAYDERLRLLPSYLQQLEMESNGKSVTLDGAPVGRATAPITWGGVGTDAQHAVFQLLHQGTHLVPVEFVAAIEPEHGLAEEHHRQLLINCFAQGAALMAGRAIGRSASRLSRRPALDDDPARPARSARRSARCSLSTSTAPSPTPCCSASTRSTSSASSSARRWRKRDRRATGELGRSIPSTAGADRRAPSETMTR